MSDLNTFFSKSGSSPGNVGSFMSHSGNSPNELKETLVSPAVHDNLLQAVAVSQNPPEPLEKFIDLPVYRNGIETGETKRIRLGQPFELFIGPPTECGFLLDELIGRRDNHIHPHRYGVCTLYVSKREALKLDVLLFGEGKKHRLNLPYAIGSYHRDLHIPGIPSNNLLLPDPLQGYAAHHLYVPGKGRLVVFDCAGWPDDWEYNATTLAEANKIKGWLDRPRYYVAWPAGEALPPKQEPIHITQDAERFIFERNLAALRRMPTAPLLKTGHSGFRGTRYTDDFFPSLVRSASHNRILPRIPELVIGVKRRKSFNPYTSGSCWSDVPKNPRQVYTGEPGKEVFEPTPKQLAMWLKKYTKEENGERRFKKQPRPEFRRMRPKYEFPNNAEDEISLSSAVRGPETTHDDHGIKETFEFEDISESVDNSVGTGDFDGEGTGKQTQGGVSISPVYEWVQPEKSDEAESFEEAIKKTEFIRAQIELERILCLMDLFDLRLLHDTRTVTENANNTAKLEILKGRDTDVSDLGRPGPKRGAALVFKNEWDRRTGGEFNTEAELRKAMGEDYRRPEIHCLHVLDSSLRRTVTKLTKKQKAAKAKKRQDIMRLVGGRPKPAGTIDIIEDPNTLKGPETEFELWRQAIEVTFKRSAKYIDGLYMLVQRKRQPTRAYLLIEAKDFPAPDDRVYIDEEQFRYAKTQLAKRLKMDARLLRGQCQVLTFVTDADRLHVTMSDWEECQVDYPLQEIAHLVKPTESVE